MSMFEKFVNQCRKPEGRLGTFVGVSMNWGHATLRKWGLRCITVHPDATVLDIGCGGGKTVQALSAMASQGKTYGIDYSETMVALARTLNQKKIAQGIVDIAYGTVSELPFRDGMFDLVTAFETCYFWPNFTADLKEIRRVLNAGGRLVIANEVYRDEKFARRNEKFANLLAMNIYAPDEYRDCMTDAGYQNIHVSTIPEKNWIMIMAEK